MASSGAVQTAASIPQFEGPLAPGPRLVSVDILRGLVMVIMALDHTRDYFTYLRFSPEDLQHTYPALFLTRFVTHFCAPVFSFLAGTGAYLSVARGKSVRQASHFFWTRGLWLVLLELTVLNFAWNFSFPHVVLVQVIWALGWSMVAMAFIVRLPLRWIAGLGIAIIGLHNLLDRVTTESFGRLSGLWTVLHVTGFLRVTSWLTLRVGYPLIPWIGVMAAGYAFGAVLQRPDRRKWIFRLGLAVTLAFFALRAGNHYGNSVAGAPSTRPSSVGPWSVQNTGALTVISFFDTLKYPPSLDYLLMTLGPAFLALAWFDGMQGRSRLARVLLVYGRVPLFYYVLHVFLIHAMAIVIARLSHQPVAWLWRPEGFLGNPVPIGYGHGLPFVYAIWITVVVILYVPCRRYMEFKQRHRDWSWLSYV